MEVTMHPSIDVFAATRGVSIATRALEDRHDGDEDTMLGKTDTPLSMCSICSGKGW